MKNQHLIIVSVDAMFYEDLAFLEKQPNMGKLLRAGSVVKRMTTIYPSLTHPVHATLMSGNPAGKTGVINNTLFAPEIPEAPWFNQLSQMQCETIFHAAKRAGLTTCACRWPMTAGGFDVIDWLVPEVLEYESQLEPNREKLYQRVCSPNLFEDIVKPNLFLLDDPERYPSYEIFSMTCAAEIIRKHKPNLLLTHPGMVDHNRHLSGLFSPLVEDSLRMTDEWIGMLMQAVEDAGIADRTSYCIVSDHGHLEYSRIIALNALFAEKGLLKVQPDGSLGDWELYCHGSGLAAQVYVKDKARKAEFAAMLQEMCRQGLYGFNEMFTAEETQQRYGLTGDFDFVLEGDGCTAFSSKWTGPVVQMNSRTEFGEHRSSHGHRPEKGFQPPMVVSGPAFRQGIELEKGTVLDEAPTFAAAMGLIMPQAQGNPIRELLV